MITQIFRRNITVGLWAVIIGILSVYGFNHWQNYTNLGRLNNHNLSPNARVITVKNAANTSLTQFLQRVQQTSALKRVQVQLVSKKKKSITYFYGRGSYSIPPMKSGKFFSNADYTADQPVAVVGSALTKQLYRPKGQAYIKLGGQYVPVIGIMGGKYNSRLNHQIFVTGMMTVTDKIKLSNFQIWVDTPTTLQTSTLKHNLQATSIRRTTLLKVLHEQTASSVDWKALVLLVGLFGLMAAFIWLWHLVVIPHHIAVADSFEARVFAFRQWGLFVIYTALGLLGGLIIGAATIKLLTYAGISEYLLGLLVAAALMVYLCLHRRLQLPLKLFSFKHKSEK